MPIYPERESKTLEFKSDLPALKALVKTCVAFANTAGGSIIVGVQDGTRELVGVSASDRDRLYDEFPNSLYDSTSPALFAHVYEKNIDGIAVMVIDVPPSARKPVCVKKEGVPKGVYLRVGSSNRRAEEEHLHELVREGQRHYYDEELTNASLSDLSTHLLSQCYGKAYSEKKLLSEGVIGQGAFDSAWYATVAGVLMFSDAPEMYVPEAGIICTHFSGTEGREIIQTRELRGAISDISQECLRLLSHWLDRHFQLKGVALKGKAMIPEAALREAIINALMHRKYFIPSAVKIALYDDRLEIFSPGAFPGLVDINNLGDGTTYLRNPHLTKIARRMHLIEKLGTGIRLIFDVCKKAGLREPRYVEDGDYVKVIFSFVPRLDQRDDEKALLDLLDMKGELSIQDVVEHLGVSRNTATRKLSVLLEQGLIERRGKGPSVRYQRLAA